jgi:hypothetical protein
MFAYFVCVHFSIAAIKHFFSHVCPFVATVCVIFRERRKMEGGDAAAAGGAAAGGADNDAFAPSDRMASLLVSNQISEYCSQVKTVTPTNKK